MSLVTSDSPNTAVSYRTVQVDGVDIFYREAGPAGAPVVLLLHGFPSSSHMFRDLMPLLATQYRVIAPDYPGFGHSAEPPAETFAYRFGTIAGLIDRFATAVGADRYVLYVQDYGGPVGFRLAMAHPERVRGIIIQNAVVNAEGWNPDIVAQFVPFWQNRSAETEQPLRAFLRPETTRFQYQHGATRTDRLSPDAWTMDQAGLDRPGNDAIQLDLLFDYQDNVAQYPAWQNFLRTYLPPVLVAWGENDPFFVRAGASFYQSLVPSAELHFLDAGHFALETHAPEIAALALDFLARL